MKSVESYKFELYPLTTLFIGSQEAWEPYEYVLKDGHIVKVKTTQLLNRLASRSMSEVESYTNAAASQPVDAVAMIDREVLQDGTLVEEAFPAPADFASAYAEKIRTSVDVLAIRMPCRHRSNAYIPGSSLKGSIRTAFYALMGNALGYPSEAEVFGYGTGEGYSRTMFNDPFKRFKISDVPVPHRMLGLKTISQFNIKLNKPGAPDSYAVCVGGLMSNFNDDPLALIPTLPHRGELKLEGDVKFVTYFEEMKDKLNVPGIMHATRTFSRGIVEYEMKQPLVGPWYQRFFNAIAPLMQMPDVTLIRVGAGSGRMGTSVLIYNDQVVAAEIGSERTNVSKNPHPATRKLADGIPMGWALLRFIHQ